MGRCIGVLTMFVLGAMPANAWALAGGATGSGGGGGGGGFSGGGGGYHSGSGGGKVTWLGLVIGIGAAVFFVWVLPSLIKAFRGRGSGGGGFQGTTGRRRQASKRGAVAAEVAKAANADD